MSLTRRALRRILPSIYASTNGALNHYQLFSCSPLVSPSSSLLHSSSSSLLSSPIIPSRSSIRSFSTANNNNNSPSLPSSIHRTACGLYVDRSLPRPFNKILIANRGEIACRIIRSCREIGVKAVAVYSAADRDSLHVKMADESYYIGDSAAKESYLIGERIIATAKKCGAQAIHPGYGFLSENAQFAKLCEDEGIIFIGPPPSAIESMGSKSASKHIMSAAGVPVIPGYHSDDQSIDRLRAEAEKVGYPLMIKAVSGGGGKGMRIVRSAAEFDEMLGSAQREAKNSFKDDRVLLERYITRPRHIEFQVFADKHGNAVHLFERDCSVQRRHQKVLEEAPAPGMTEALRNEMGTAAVNAAKAVGYVGAGTVEFIFDAEKNEYFFMEMNTRLQVEHPVTEMIMRKDLVQWQLHVAAGNKLPADQSQITSAHGHAIEARIYAENPYNQFLPCTGKLIHLQPPVKAENTQSGAASDITIRVESGVREGDQVSIFYDPMIAKLCVWGSDRISALHRLHKALEDYRIVGPPTNITFVKRCVLHPKFIAGGVETGFIAQNATELLKTDENPINSTQAAVAATLYLMLQQAANEGLSADPSDNYSLWNRSDRFRSIGNEKQFIRWQPVGEGEDPAATTNAPIHFHVERINRNGSTLSIHIINNNDTKSTTEVSPSYSVTGTLLSNGSMHCTINDSAHNVNIVLLSAAASPTASSAPQASEAHVFIDGRHHRLLLPVINFQRTAASGGGAVAPMSGKLVSVSVKAGDKVTRGTSLAIMEAMKMEHVIRASDDALVKEIYYQAGDFVEGGKLIISLQKQTK